ncbi:dynein axonemal heavy chain 2-like [Anopheles darlingi]|uniref:dynein axonemal heavy chain 2-like n=1 Tax=Anopheles darlingi TaxID=43151 RepID=UPI0021000D44|nr:dynein axonemal heavy chain 2-like [Anopheles darlingi]
MAAENHEGDMSEISSLTDSSDEGKKVVEEVVEAVEEVDKPAYSEEDLETLVGFIRGMIILFDYEDEDFNDEVAETIKLWLTDANNPLLFIFYDGNRLSASLAFPLCPINDLMYFMREQDQLFNVLEQFHDDILFGTLHGDIEGSLLVLLEQVYGPMILSNVDWSESVKANVINGFNAFMTYLSELHYKLSGFTLLYVPREGSDMEVQEVVLNRSMIKRLEAVVIDWTAQIRATLSDTQHFVPDDLVCPSDEYSFWIYRHEVLSAIRLQYNGPNVQHIVRILELAQSLYIKYLRDVLRDLDKEIEIAESNIPFLKLLVDPCFAIGTLETADDFCSQLIYVMHIIRFIGQDSSYLNKDESMTKLFLYLSNEIVACCMRGIDVDRILSGAPRYGIEICKMKISCCESYKIIYEEMLEHFKSEITWNLDYAAIFNRINAFLQRLHDILEVCDAMLIFGKYAEGTSYTSYRFFCNNAAEYERRCDQVEKIFHGALATIESVGGTILDINNKHWYRYIGEFRDTLKSLDDIIENLLSNVFLMSENLEEKLNVLVTLLNFYQRESVRESFMRKIGEVWSIFNNEIIQLSKDISAGITVYPALLPSHAGRYAVLKMRFDHLTHLRTLIVNCRFFPEYPKQEEVLTLYEACEKQVKFALKGFNESWSKSIPPDMASWYQRNLICRSNVRPGLFEVNIERRLLLLFDEAHYFKILGAPVPMGLDLEKHENTLLTFDNVLRLVLYFNGVISSISDKERLFFKPMIQQTERKLEPLRSKLTWEEDLSEFIDGYVVNVRELLELIELYKRENQKIVDLVERIYGMVFVRLDLGQHPVSMAQLIDGMTEQKQTVLTELVQVMHEISTKIFTVRDSIGSNLRKMSSSWEHYVRKIDKLLTAAIFTCTFNTLRGVHSALENANSNPILLIEILLKQEGTVYEPPVEAVEQTLRRLTDEVCMTIKPVNSMAKYNELDDGERSFYVQLLEHPEYRQICGMIDETIDETVRLMRMYQAKWNVFRPFWCVDKVAFIERFKLSAMTSEAFQTNIEKFEELQNQLSTQGELIVCRCVEIDALKLKYALTSHIAEWQTKYIDYLKCIAYGKIIDFNNVLKSNVEELRHEPKEVYELKRLEERYQACYEELPTKEQEIGTILKYFVVLEKYVADLLPEAYELRHNIDRIWAQYRADLREIREQIDNYQDQFKLSMTGAADALKVDALEMLKMLREEMPTAEELSPGEAFEAIDRLMMQLEVLEQREREIEEKFGVLGVSYLRLPAIQEIRSKLEHLKAVWVFVEEWHIFMTQIMDQNYHTVDEIELQALSNHFKQTCTSLREGPIAEEGFDVFLRTADTVAQFHVTARIVCMMKNSFLQERHWQMVKNIVKASPHRHPFQARIDYWEQTLGLLQEILEMLVELQAECRTLFEFQRLNDPSASCSELNCFNDDFSVCFAIWCEQIRYISTARLVEDVCPAGREFLEELEIIRRSINQQMEQLKTFLTVCRDQFPRFYLLSDWQLVSFLAQPFNRQQFQRTLAIIYENVVGMSGGAGSLESMKSAGIESVYTRDGECIPLAVPLRAHEEASTRMPRGTVGMMIQLDRSIRDALQDLLPKCHSALRAGYFKRVESGWLRSWPLQLCLKSAELQTTQHTKSALAQCSLLGRKKPLKMLRCMHTKMLEQLTACARQGDDGCEGADERWQRKKLNDLLIVELNARDLIERLYRKPKLHGLQSIEWISQLHSYLDPTSRTGKSVAIRVALKMLEPPCEMHRLVPSVLRKLTDPKSFDRIQFDGIVSEALSKGLDPVSTSVRKCLILDSVPSDEWIMGAVQLARHAQYVCRDFTQLYVADGSGRQETASPTQNGNHVKVIVECSSPLDTMTPSAVSHFALVHIGPGDLRWQELIEVWLKSMQHNAFAREWIGELTKQHFGQLLAFRQRECPTVATVNDVALARTFIKLFNSLLSSFDSSKMERNLEEEILRKLFFFCCVWSIGGSLEEDASRGKYDVLMREHHPEAAYPLKGTVFQYHVDLSEGVWRSWETLLTPSANDRSEHAEGKMMSPSASVPSAFIIHREAVEQATKLLRCVRFKRVGMMLVGRPGGGRSVVCELAARLAPSPTAFHRINTADLNEPGQMQQQFLALFRKCLHQRTLAMINLDGLVDGREPNERLMELLNRIVLQEDLSVLFCDNLAPPPLKQSTEGWRTSFPPIDWVKVQHNLHLILCVPSDGATYRMFSLRYPSLLVALTVNCVHDWPPATLLEISKKYLLKNVPLNVPIRLAAIATGGAPLLAAESSKQKTRTRESLVQSTEERLQIATHDLLFRIHYGAETEVTFLIAGKRNIIAPCSWYFELLHTFERVLREKRLQMQTLHQKYRVGIERILDATAKVASLSEELVERQREIALFQEQLNEFLDQISLQKQEAAIQTEEVSVKRVKIGAEEIVCKQLANVAEADLQRAMPALNAAVSALDSLNKKDMNEIKSYSRPPTKVELVMEAVMILLGKEPTWAESKRQLGEQKFLETLKGFDRNNIAERTLKTIAGYVRNPELEPEKVGTVSKAAKSLMLWVRAIDNYGKVYKYVGPKIRKMEEANASLLEKQNELIAAERKLRELAERLAELQAEYEMKIEEKRKLEEVAREMALKLERARSLVNNLASERVRWTTIKNGLEADYVRLIGDSLLASGCLTYYGPLDIASRTVLFDQWIIDLQTMEAPFTAQFSLTAFFYQPEVLVRWKENGLPPDDFSAENATILLNSTRAPLIVDPQEEAQKWLLAELDDARVVLVDFDDEISEETVVQTFQQHVPFVVENVNRRNVAELDELFVLQHSSTVSCALCNATDSSSLKRHFVHVISREPLLLPEHLLKSLNQLSFVLGAEGLEVKMLALLVEHENPSLEERKAELQCTILKNKQTLTDLEERILRILNESTIPLLEDQELYEVLQTSRETDEIVSEELKQAEVARGEIETARDVYQSCAERSALLFLVLGDLQQFNPLYSYSLEWYKMLFLQSLERAGRVQVVNERKRRIDDYHTFNVFGSVCRGLFSSDRTLFAFYLCARLLFARESLNPREFRFLVFGAGKIDRNEQMENPCSGWLAEGSWDQLTDLDRVPGFHGIIESFYELPENWKRWYRSPVPEEAPLPGSWEANLKRFQKYLIVRCLRQDRIESCMTEFTKDTLGERYIKLPTVISLEDVLQESSAQTLILLLIRDNSNPLARVERLGQKVRLLAGGVGGSIRQLNMTDDRLELFIEMLQRCVADQSWLYVGDCHLSELFLRKLPQVVVFLKTIESQSHFRLWLACQPHEAFPVSVLQNCIKLAYEEPKGIKHTMRNLYDDLGETKFQGSIASLKDAGSGVVVGGGTTFQTHYMRFLYGVSFLHGLLQERSNFQQLGWVEPYHFVNSDFSLAERLLAYGLDKGALKKVNIPRKPRATKVKGGGSVGNAGAEDGMQDLALAEDEQEHDPTPWQFIREVLLEICYGIQFVCGWDRRVYEEYVGELFQSQVLLSPLGSQILPHSWFKMPRDVTYQAYVGFIGKQLPDSDGIDVFGQHENANIKYLKSRSDYMLQMLSRVAKDLDPGHREHHQKQQQQQQQHPHHLQHLGLTHEHQQ